MKKIYSLGISILTSFSLQAQDCTDLFISEYVEGTFNNKAIELYNPTNEDIDLSNYSLSRWSNGGTTPLNTVLSGSIQAKSAYVIGLDKRNPNGEGYEEPLWNGWYVFTDSTSQLLDSIYTAEDDLMSLVDLFICPNYEDGTMYFNGNDAITLETASGDIIDIFGKIGEDPGDAWADENNTWWTKDQTLVRKSEVTSGFVYDNSQPYSFDPAFEWDSLPQNTFTELGKHICDCNETSINEKEVFLNIFPNPNNTGVLFIESSDPVTKIKMYNVLGQNVFSKTYQNGIALETLILDSSLSGIYFVEILLQNNKRQIKKLHIK
jgi:hypothetical protein